MPGNVTFIPIPSPETQRAAGRPEHAVYAYGGGIVGGKGESGKEHSIPFPPDCCQDVRGHFQ